MSTQELQQRTAVNIQEKANLIWAIAESLLAHTSHMNTVRLSCLFALSIKGFGNAMHHSNGNRHPYL